MSNDYVIRQINEDFERIEELDKMYIWEKENEVWEEYEDWIEKQEKLPAKITIKLSNQLQVKEENVENIRK